MQELSGLQEEVKALGRRRDELETGLLEQMERTETAKAQHGEADGVRESAVDQEASARAAHGQVKDALEGERQKLVGERDEAMTYVDETLVARYEKLRPQLRGVAVGRLEGEMCGACRVRLPSSEFQRLSGSDELDRCPECRRLLVTDRLLAS